MTRIYLALLLAIAPMAASAQMLLLQGGTKVGAGAAPPPPTGCASVCLVLKVI